MASRNLFITNYSAQNLRVRFRKMDKSELACVEVSPGETKHIEHEEMFLMEMLESNKRYGWIESDKVEDNFAGISFNWDSLPRNGMHKVLLSESEKIKKKKSKEKAIEGLKTSFVRPLAKLQNDINDRDIPLRVSGTTRDIAMPADVVLNATLNGDEERRIYDGADASNGTSLGLKSAEF